MIRIKIKTVPICLAGVVLIMAAVGSSCSVKEKQNLILTITPEKSTEEKESEEIIYEGMVSEPQVQTQKNPFLTLNVATYITKIENTYFIADCYHNQIIFHDNITDPLNQWDVLTDEVHYAHTIATDKVIILIDDTENNRLMAFQKTKEGYVHTQTLENIGLKPHYVQYDEKNKAFMAWSSITGEMYLIKRAAQPGENGIYPLYIENVLKIDELFGVYVRSFTLLDDAVYFVSGHNNQKIIKAVQLEDGFEIIEEYPVPDEISGMVQLMKIGDYFYLTISTDNQENQDYATIIRTDDLKNLSSGKYEKVYNQFGISGGTPYYITNIEGRYYMTHHRTSENIIAFDSDGSTIENVEVIY